MKNLQKLGFTALFCSLFTFGSLPFIGGCASTTKFVTIDNAQIATRFVASKALQYAVGNEARAEMAAYLYSAAVGLRSISAGQGVPSPELVRSTTKQFLKPGSKWQILANDIADVYAVMIWPNIQGKPAEAWKWIEAMASGLEEAAKAYLPGIILPPMPHQTPQPTQWPGPDFSPEPR